MEKENVVCYFGFLLGINAGQKWSKYDFKNYKAKAMKSLHLSFYKDIHFPFPFLSLCLSFLLVAGIWAWSEMFA